jgi:hypothetical protein
MLWGMFCICLTKSLPINRSQVAVEHKLKEAVQNLGCVVGRKVSVKKRKMVTVVIVYMVPHSWFEDQIESNIVHARKRSKMDGY